MIGIALIDKPLGLTSHDVVHRIRKTLGTKRVGHAGSLDPMATGLLVVAVGPATRFLQYLPLEPKVYECSFHFGVTTTTYDKEGEVTAEQKVPDNLEELIQDQISSFVGLIEQTPPIYSAIKVAGSPLYKYARRGEDVHVDPRRVFVETYQTLGFLGQVGKFRIVCSGGTYVRSLAHDLGQLIGCGAHVSELRRTEAGRFQVTNAVSLDSFQSSDLMSLADALGPMPIVELNDGQCQRVQNGLWVKSDNLADSIHVALANPNGQVMSVARVDGKLLHPLCVIPQEAVNGSL